MSKQLTLSATAAVLSMALVAVVTSFGGFSGEPAGQLAGNAPLFGLTVTR
ncbi:hypothetical protein [Qipengyuania marisflavi]|nr:hypothetical protein [Qipengyuania marisflavi]